MDCPSGDVSEVKEQIERVGAEVIPHCDALTLGVTGSSTSEFLFWGHYFSSASAKSEPAAIQGHETPPCPATIFLLTPGS